MSAEISEAMKERAIEIADECMRSDVECCGIYVRPRVYGLSNDTGREVKTLAEAGAMLKIAFQWLSDRGMARLQTDAHGEVIVLEPSPPAGRAGRSHA